MGRPSTALALAVALVLGLGGVGQGQTPRLVVAREKVVARDMEIQEVQPPHRSGPYGATPTGLIWTKSVLHESVVNGVRIHLRFLGAPGTSGWSLRVHDVEGVEVERLGPDSPGVRRGETWTEDVSGRGARLELWADRDPGALQVVVDRYAYRVLPVYVQSISGQDERVGIRGASARVQGWAAPVARLRFMTDSGRGLCTGFLVADDLLLTNQHCISNQAEMLSAVVEFGYDAYGAAPERFRVARLEASSPGLDYSLLRLAGQPGRTYGTLPLRPAARLAEAAPLVIIQHPAGEPKQASVVGCQVNGGARPGTDGTATDFGHVCDTLGGSSGSPVIDASRGEVVGLHHLGFIDGQGDPVNQAVHARLILESLAGNLRGQVRVSAP